MKAYAAFARTRFADLLANRSRFVMGIISYFIYVSVYAAIFRAIYRGSTGEVGGLQATEALTYVAVAWVLRSFYTNSLDRDITQEVVRGDIVQVLLRPVDYPASKLAVAAGEAVTRALIFTLPAGMLVFVAYGVQPPANPLAASGFLTSVVLAFAIYTQVNLLVGIAAVFTEHTIGLQRSKNAMMDLFGGVLLPLTFFPVWAQEALFLLPFQAVTYTPVAIYLGKLGILSGLAVQALWFMLLAVLVRLSWRQALVRLTVHGG
ncbi:MAG: ABC-2 family transporter protein [Trueperaceae bacterium]